MANETEALIEEMVQALRSVMKKAHETGNCGVCGGNGSADDCDNDECPIAKVRAALAAYEQTLEGATKRKSDRLAPSATTGEEKEDGERDEGYRQLKRAEKMATNAAVKIAEKMCDGLYKPDDSMARPEDYYDLIDAELRAEREAAERLFELVGILRGTTLVGGTLRSKVDEALAAYEKATKGGA